MFERRTPRFAVEVLVLVALALSLTIAHLNRLVIAGTMLLGWLIVSIVEWASLRGEAHYGSGLPPRYFVPQVRLPPPLTIEESQVRLPRALTPEEAVLRYAPPARPVEEPVWVASPVFEQAPKAIGGWSVIAPEDEVAPLEPELAPEWAPPVELEPESEPSIASEPELEPESEPEELEPIAEVALAEPEFEDEPECGRPEPSG